MKKLIFTIILAPVLVASAANMPAPAKKNLTPEELAAKKAKAYENYLKHTGGPVTKPGTQKGEIVYVNCQSRAQKAWIEASIAYFVKETKYKVTLKEGGAFDIKNPKIEGNASLYIVDDPALPVILVAPESRWALVNVAPIAKEERPAYFEARVKKELTRGFAYLCGAANSQYPQALTRMIAGQAELDTNPDLQLPMDVLQRIRTSMEPLGVTPAKIYVYRKACEEGWAPQPTNDYQKAIWNQVFSIPDKPIKIEKKK